MLVDDGVAVRAELDAGTIQLESARVGPSTDCQQHTICWDHLAVAEDRSRRFEAGDRDAGAYGDAISCEHRQQDASSINVFARKYARARLNDRHRRSEPRERLTQLTADAPGSDHEKLLGTSRQCPHRVGRQHVNPLNPADRRDYWH